MRRVEVDRLDVHRVGGQVAHHVAAARRDRHQPAGRPELQGRQVDLRILPDLGVDQTLEHAREHALEHAALGGGRRLQGSVAHEGVGQLGLLGQGQWLSATPAAPTVTKLAGRSTQQPVLKYSMALPLGPGWSNTVRLGRWVWPQTMTSTPLLAGIAARAVLDLLAQAAEADMGPVEPLRPLAVAWTASAG